MQVSLRPYVATDLPAFRALVAEPGLEREFERLRPAGMLEAWLDTHHLDRPATLLATSDGEPAGLALTYVLPQAGSATFSITRLGVAERFRNRGLGTTLLGAALESLRSRASLLRLREICSGTWSPNQAATRLFAKRGLRRVRFTWMMERPHGPVPQAAWPPGVDCRVFDASERAFRDWNQAYNASFAQHYHFVPSTEKDERELASDPDFHADGLMLAYRDGRCVGFCRNSLTPELGELAMLGVAPEARGIGLGRALLRWGTAWLEAKRARRVTLMVDGDNEGAIRLYRSEGYDVAQTRETWAREIPERAARGMGGV
jgi:mycothiol synthase